MADLLKGTQVLTIPAKYCRTSGLHIAQDSRQADGTFCIKSYDPLARLMLLRFICPCGCRSVGHALLHGPDVPKPGPEDGPCWSWDGSFDAPTLTPSLHRVRGCGWHGWLRAGVWVQA